jgi:hypothetical protein
MSRAGDVSTVAADCLDRRVVDRAGDAARRRCPTGCAGAPDAAPVDNDFRRRRGRRRRAAAHPIGEQPRTVMITMITASNVSRTMQNSAIERTTIRLIRWYTSQAAWPSSPAATRYAPTVLSTRTAIAAIPPKAAIAIAIAAG